MQLILRRKQAILSSRRFLPGATWLLSHSAMLAGRTDIYTGPKMKGKRKIKNAKWPLLLQFQVEARRTLAKRSKKSASRFLDSVSLFVMDREPSGGLAGGACQPVPETTIN